MAEAAIDGPEIPAKSRKTALILGLILALAGAGAGYFVVASGTLPMGSHKTESPSDHTPASAAPSFVALDPIMVSLNGQDGVQHLRFRAQLEVESDSKREVEAVLPRVTDVLNGYLRALELNDFRDPLALTRLRGQMLRRIQVVAGKGRVRDLLIIDFVLN